MKAKVLVVDDEPEVLESTCLLVEALGYQAIRVAEPKDIVATVQRERPALILQDLKMPGLNVAGLVAALRLDPVTAEIPLVFFSAGTDLATTAARYDAWGHLAKPFGRAEFAKLLEDVLGPSETSAGGKPNAQAQEARAVFHDYWNLLAALSNYILVLDEVQGLPPEARKAVRGLDDLILKLESKTDLLGIYVRAVVDAKAVSAWPRVAK